MADEKREPADFKVVDRRLFSSEGVRREGVSKESEAPAAQQAAPAQPGAQAPRREAQEFYTELGVGFDTLVSFLGTTAMFQLGSLTGPGGERIPPDLPNARRTIDMLDVLEHKTSQNLTEEEAKLVEEVLYDLRMKYVETEKQLSKKVR